MEPHHQASWPTDSVAADLVDAENDARTPATDVDGVEDTSGAGEESITNPWDPTKSKFETRPYTVDLLLRRVDHGEIDLEPDFQRKAGLWSGEQKSRLIESLLVRIPLPAFYFDATNESKWLVVDGLQRLTVFREFVRGDMRLERLEFLSSYEKLRFDELPRDLRRRIEETQVVVHLIQPGTPPEVKFNIFRRINTGGLVLTGQEIRHALFQGRSTRLLNELAQSSSFKRATAGSIKPDRMVDREFVLRFLAFMSRPYTEYRVPDMDAFLNGQMAAINKMEDAAISDLSIRFNRAMDAAHRIFGEHTFRKLYVRNQFRMPINKALFEVWSVCLGRLEPSDLDFLVEHREDLISGAMRALNDRPFETAVSVGTQDVKKVHLRFATVAAVVREVLNPSQGGLAV
ncbi:MAG TPA: DUF262 domain-containing protein [Longimicrobium sp.]|jgi:hypothetical protein